MYHIVFKKEEFLLPTGITIKADDGIQALSIFAVTHPNAQFMVMYRINEYNGGLQW